jgi:DNA replication protein DnaC
LGAEAGLGDHLAATALVDRMVHHSQVIVINGPP